MFAKESWDAIERFFGAYRVHEAAVKARRAALNIRHNNKARRRLFRLSQIIVERLVERARAG